MSLQGDNLVRLHGETDGAYATGAFTPFRGAGSEKLFEGERRELKNNEWRRRNYLDGVRQRIL